MKRTVLLLVLAALSLHAQDGGMVLRTLVGYNAQKNSLALTEEQRKEVERLGQEGQRLGFTGQFGEALRRFYHGTAIMNGAAWTPPVELAASLQLKLDSALPEHGRPLTVSLHPLFPVERAAGEKVLVTVALVPAGPAGTPQGEGRVLASRAALDGSKLPWSLAVTLPSNDTGRYFLEARLAPAEGAPDLKARAAFLKRLPVAIDSLAENAARLRTRLAATKSTSTELPTAQYALQLFELASRGEANPHRFDFRKEFDNAQAVLDALDKGESGFASKRGDFRKAYRSDVDKTLQPYRLFVPAAYDPAKKTPLVVALHGMGGDENSIFDVYSNGAIKKEGERLGWLIVAPKGRDSASMYRGSAEKDVLDVIAEVERDYNIDPDRIYLMGHSMGAYGAWSIAMNHPRRFAALGPVAGGGNPSGMAAIRHLPQYVVHGDNDKTVPVAQSRAMVEAAKKAGARVEYKEISGGGHNEVFAPSFTAIFDFFAQHARAAAPSR